MGSGSTGKAAMLEGFGFIGIEREADYLAIARARIEAAQAATEFMKNPPLATVTIAQEATQNIAQLELA
jgi:DNA modification methylase